MVAHSNVAPGFSPARAALKGGATINVALHRCARLNSCMASTLRTRSLALQSVGYQSTHRSAQIN